MAVESLLLSIQSNKNKGFKNIWKVEFISKLNISRYRQRELYYLHETHCYRAAQTSSDECVRYEQRFIKTTEMSADEKVA